MAPLYITICVSLLLGLSNAAVYSVCPEDCECLQNEEISDIRGTDLVDVDCKNKGLTEVPDLSSLENATIHRLYLDGNRITSLPDKAFDGFRIIGIELTDNPLSHISQHAFKGLEYHLEYLSMQRIPLSHRPSQFLRGLSMLRTLDLTGVPSPSMTTLTNSTFSTLRMLETLVIKDCGIRTIEESAFIGVESIMNLKLEQNKLTDVPVSSFRHLMELRTLDLSLNQISKLPRNAFLTLINLQKLSLSDNSLSDNKNIDSAAFRGIGHNLMELDLSFNKMKDLPKHTFDHLFNLGTLKVADNEVSFIHNGTFEKMTHLMTLDLSGNPATITPGNIRGLEMSLVNLHLARTGITSETIPLDALQRLRYLLHLDLSRNELGSLSNSSFSGLSTKKLRLSHCGIILIESDTFNQLKAPLDVELDHNRIETVKFASNPCTFQKLNLNHNPLICDCDFLSTVREETTKFVGKCESPEEANGEDIKMASKKADIEELCKFGNFTDAEGESKPEKKPIICSWMASGTSTSRLGVFVSAWYVLLSFICARG